MLTTLSVKEIKKLKKSLDNIFINCVKKNLNLSVKCFLADYPHELKIKLSLLLKAIKIAHKNRNIEIIYAICEYITHNSIDTI